MSKDKIKRTQSWGTAEEQTMENNMLMAYGMTYAKGINPEAVPDLLSALHGMLNIGIAISTGHEAHIEARKEAAKAAIEKAKLNK